MRKQPIIYILVLVLGVVGKGLQAREQQEDIELRQRKEVTVSSEVIPLENVLVDVSGELPEEKLHDMYLGLSPVPGNTQWVTRMEIKLELRKLGMGAGEDFSFSGPDRTRVVRTRKNRSASEGERFRSSWIDVLSREIRKRIQKREGMEKAEINVRILRLFSRQGDVPKQGRNQIKIHFERSIYSGNVPVQIQIRDGGGTYRTRVLAAISMKIPVLKAGRHLRVGETVRGRDLETGFRSIPQGLNPIMNRSEVVGKTVKNKIAEGEILAHRNLKRKSIIEEGDQVQFLIKPGGITMKQAAIAKEDGAIGDTITLEVSEDQKVTGIVQSRHLVRGKQQVKELEESHETQK